MEKLSIWLGWAISREREGAHNSLGGCCLTRFVDMACLFWLTWLKQQHQCAGYLASLQKPPQWRGSQV
ncbi:uncharacterized protein PGTG_21208 [Puccinia graminis f. sp. tritici CRL 75-36-700-3]|uniref:Uncharacterized protein n=1 Tax=Puccinia graminis f. sp. tritici (strain CRL 75-36-700-3 / race SCCL) TaxID=418459 RepID=H6QQM4_PUCGT|nr:uncharacterized protein PGTG_21208 [Puccinia graminis f. sp. tritici CRL 75-36-700-3]EHS62742.1 hypothetical protein PGTG_21208 [Puccinia graminis f. sp. tritici CRL 75-36-700-3]